MRNRIVALSADRVRRSVALLLLVCSVSVAVAVAEYDFRDFTPSGAQIRSQASATFLDSDDVRRETLSNVVVTIVQSVAGVRLTPDGESAAARTVSPGAQVAFPFIVTNSGNDSASFDVSAVLEDGADARLGAPLVYHDENCNGRLDAGETTLTPLSQLSLESGATGCVLLLATAHAGADAGDATVTLSVGVDGDAVADEVTQRSASATVTVTNAAVLTSALQAEPSAVVAPDGLVTLTASVSNTSGVDAHAFEFPDLPGTPNPSGIFTELSIPEGLRVESVTATSGVADDDLALFEHDGNAWAALNLDELPATVTRIGVLVPGSGAFYPSGAQTVVSVGVREASAGGAGSTFAARASVRYSAGAAGELVEAESNQVTVTKGRAAAVAWVDAADESLSVASSDGTADRAEDERSVTELHSGVTLTIRDTLRNDGNASERYALAVAALGADAPQAAKDAWLCRLYQRDGVTPLPDTVGPVPAGETLAVVVRCDVPNDPNDAAQTLIRLSATTVDDASTDASVDWSVASVDEGFGASYTAVSTPAAAIADGDTASIVLRLTNAGVNPDTFDLGATTAQSGWLERVALYHLGGTVASGELCPSDASALTAARSSARVTTSGIVNPGMSRCILADITLLRGAVSGERTITFTSESINRDSVAPSVESAITVAHRSGLQFTPARSATITSGGSVNVNHTVRNTGNTQGTLAIGAPVVSPEGSVRVLYSLDGTTFSTSLDGIVLAPGQERTLTLRAIASAGQPVGRRITVTPTATIDYGQALGALSRSLSNTYDVIDGVLRLDLQVANCGQAGACGANPAGGDEARPRDYLRYTLTATNLGAAAIREVVVTEPIPAFTEFVSIDTEASFLGTVQYSRDGSSWGTGAPPALSAGDVIYVRVVNGGADVPIPPAGSVTVTLTVRVR